MTTDFDKQLQEKLNSHLEQPPASCWESISSNLDKLPIGQQAAGESAAQSTSWSSQFFTSLAGKISIGLITAAAVAGISFWLLSDKTNREDPVSKNEVQNAPNNPIDPEFVLQTTEQQPIKQYQNKIETNSLNDSCFKIETEQTNLSDFKPISETVTKEKPDRETEIHQSVKDDIDNSSSSEKAAVKPAFDRIIKKIKQEKPTKKVEESSEQAIVEPTSDLQIDFDLSHQPEIKIPNIISPNGDGLNDCLEIFGKDDCSFNHLIVYSKEGRVVFEQQNYQDNWCADNLPNGVYFYLFKFIFEQEEFLRKGSITVVR